MTCQKCGVELHRNEITICEYCQGEHTLFIAGLVFFALLVIIIVFTANLEVFT